MGRDRAGSQASAGWAGDLGLQRASELLSFHPATTIADWGYVFIEGTMVFVGYSIAELRVHESVKKYKLGLEGQRIRIPRHCDSSNISYR